MEQRGGEEDSVMPHNGAPKKKQTRTTRLEGGGSAKNQPSECPHQRDRRRCKQCSGSHVCPHKRRRSRCKDCGGAGLCPHQREKSKCKECGGSGICEHQRQRNKCKDCGGASICRHQRESWRCKQCGGTGICPHQRESWRCKECQQHAQSTAASVAGSDAATARVAVARVPGLLAATRATSSSAARMASIDAATNAATADVDG